MTETEWLDRLYDTLQGRQRPEDIAKLVFEHRKRPAHWLLWKHRSIRRTYMSREFEQQTPLTHSANVLAELIGMPLLTDEMSLGKEFDELLLLARRTIGHGEGTLDFKATRLNREARQKSGIELSHRRYNKLFRLIAFLEDERAGSLRHAELTTLLKEAKQGIVRNLCREDFGRNSASALFIAYYTACLGRRSEFTIAPQQRAFDDLGDALLKDLFQSPSADWWSIAHVFPRADVLKNLTERQKLILLGYAGTTMERSARLLQKLAVEFDSREGYVVQRGQNSSAWNAAAGAWNKARDFWLSLSTNLNLDTSDFLPGKVPRLIAADVAAWHRRAGNLPHPVERISQLLPPAWGVFLEGYVCNESMVREACAKVGVDPDKTGWTSPRALTEVADWKPTPELVHGVTVSNPEMALLMRRMGFYSGPSKWERENYGNY